MGRAGRHEGVPGIRSLMESLDEARPDLVERRARQAERKSAAKRRRRAKRKQRRQRERHAGAFGTPGNRRNIGRSGVQLDDRHTATTRATREEKREWFEEAQRKLAAKQEEAKANAERRPSWA